MNFMHCTFPKCPILVNAVSLQYFQSFMRYDPYKSVEKKIVQLEMTM